MNVPGPFKVKVVYYDDAVEKGVIYVLPQSNVEPGSMVDCGGLKAWLCRKTVGYTRYCWRTSEKLEKVYGSPLFVLGLVDGNGRCDEITARPEFMWPERRVELDALLQPALRRRLGLAAEVIRDSGKHIGTVLQLSVLAGDDITTDDCGTLRSPGDPDILGFVWNKRCVTVRLKCPVLSHAGEEEYVHTAGERLARMLVGFTTDQRETVVISDPDPVASLFEQYRYAGPSST